MSMANRHITNTPAVHISELNFSDGTSLPLNPGEIVLIVGPNNVGKSATLRSIREKVKEPASISAVLSSIKLVKSGTIEEYMTWVESWAKRMPETPESSVFSAVGHTAYSQQIQYNWSRSDHALGDIARWMCHFLSADERLQICTPPGNISFSREAPHHPIHYLQRDDTLERKLSSTFRAAFGLDLIVHRNAGAEVPLHVGQRPEPGPGEDRVSIGYISRLEELPQLQTQGDGMRSFAGVLLATSIGKESILLIDEPEAFLHPPQARQLGTTLVRDKPNGRQLFIATHSTDIVQGVLNANDSGVKVVRIRRQGNVNHVRLLGNSHIQELWSDPLLRYSNILDGLFHEGVVVCEADSDCRFYAAVLDAVQGTEASKSKRVDVLFTHCGGKARLPTVIRALRGVDVPVCSVADFDVLADGDILKKIVEALGGTWTAIEKDWRILKSAVDSKRPDLNTVEVKSEIDKILNTVTTTLLPENVRAELQAVIRKTSAWSNAKHIGKAFVPSGDPSKACERLLGELRNLGLYVVEVGELEGFARTESGHGPKWVNSVLARNLAEDSELSVARAFVIELKKGLSNIG